MFKRSMHTCRTSEGFDFVNSDEYGAKTIVSGSVYQIKVIFFTRFYLINLLSIGTSVVFL